MTELLDTPVPAALDVDRLGPGFGAEIYALDSADNGFADVGHTDVTFMARPPLGWAWARCGSGGARAPTERKRGGGGPGAPPPHSPPPPLARGLPPGIARTFRSPVPVSPPLNRSPGRSPLRPRAHRSLTSTARV